MSIKFPCPHCKKTLKVKDELAGRKAKCPACQQILTIPKPVASATDGGKAPATAAGNPAPANAPAATQTVDFNCFYCEAELHLDASLAGKQAPCPECKRIIKVPALVKNEPKDWRAPEKKGPSGAKANVVAAPEGAWGSSTSAGGVSRQALLEAGAVSEARQPRTLRQKVVLACGAVAVLFLLGGAGWLGMNWWARSRQQQIVGRALQKVSADGIQVKLGEKPNGMPDAEIHRAAGEYYLRTNKPDCVKEARKHFGFARTLLIQSPQRTERGLLLIDLALAQLDMSGTKADQQEGIRLDWDDTLKEVLQTLRHVLGDPPNEQQRETHREGLRLVARKLIARDQVGQAKTLPGKCGNEPETIAAVGLELWYAGQKETALGLADQALAFQLERDKQPGSGSPVLGTSLIALYRHFKVESRFCLSQHSLELLPKVGVSAATRVKLESLKGQVFPTQEAFLTALQPQLQGGVPAEAMKVADLARFDLLKSSNLASVDKIGIAIAALSPRESTRTEVEAALDMIKAGTPASAWQRFHLIQLALRAQVPEERIIELAGGIPETDDLRGRAQLAVLRSRLDGSRIKAEDGWLKLVPEQSAAQGLAREAVARHNARRDGGTTREVDAWEERFKPFGYIGVALGVQDGNQ